jgi:hypothetical protein
MPVKLLALLSALFVVTAACGSTTANDTTAGGEASTDEAGIAGDGTSATPEGTPAGDDDDDNGEASSGLLPGLDVVEPGSTGDRSLVDSSTGPVGALLFADTIDGPEAPSSARFEGRMLIIGGPDSDLPGPFEIAVAGAFDIANNSSDLTIDMGAIVAAAADAEGEAIPAQMQDLLTEPMQIIVIDEMGWMKWPLLSLLMGSADGGELWIELGAAEVGDATESFGFSRSAGDPTAMLERLAAAEASVEDLGVETANGVETRHWRALLDIESLAADVTAEERAELEEQFGDLTASEFPVDVWIGVADGYVYRYVLDLSSDAVLAEDAGSEVESVTMTFDFFDYNADQGISPPPAELITSGEDLFSAGFGAGLGG